MKKTTYGGTFHRFMNGRGFYAVLAVCLIAVGGVAAAVVSRGGFYAQEPTESEPSASMVEPVEQVITNQRDDRTTTTTVTTTVPTTTKTTAQSADLYVLPFGNGVQKAYSDGQPTYSVTMQDWRVHNGVDFVGDIDQTVKALADGTVLSVEEDAMWGMVVSIDHGLDVVSRYCGVQPSVTEGTEVKAGQSIGTLSAIPCESAQEPHLHLELSIDGHLVDPVVAIGCDVRYIDEDE